VVATASFVADRTDQHPQAPAALSAEPRRVEISRATGALRDLTSASRTVHVARLDHITDDRARTGMRRSESIRRSSSGGRPRVVR
jgi:hypothetical protein